MNQTSLIS